MGEKKSCRTETETLGSRGIRRGKEKKWTWRRRGVNSYGEKKSKSRHEREKNSRIPLHVGERGGERCLSPFFLLRTVGKGDLLSFEEKPLNLAGVKEGEKENQILLFLADAIRKTNTCLTVTRKKGFPPEERWGEKILLHGEKKTV